MSEDHQKPNDWTQSTAQTPPKAKMSFGIIMLVLIVLGVGGGLAFYQMRSSGEILVAEKCCDDILLGPKGALFVRTETQVRTKPSFDEGRIAYSYKRGVTVMGDVVLGPDGKTRWLKQKGDGWFILTRDLSTGAPPRLPGTTPAQAMIAPTPIEIRQIPNAKAPVMVTLPAGTTLQRVGIDANGFTEVVFEHPVYRVGYLRPASK